MRPIRKKTTCCDSRFQSTHSLRSATCGSLKNSLKSSVSIHALLAECDRITSNLKNTISCFNPRTPCGVRPDCTTTVPTCEPFQSTHSLRSATIIVHGRLSYTGFQSTHSLRSATLSKTASQLCMTVSIHALLAECDLHGCNGTIHRRQFQSTHSLRSATYSTVIFPSGEVVSIHALLAECDGGRRTFPRLL